MTHTRHLANFIGEIRWDVLPEAVRRHAVRSFVNWVGCVFGGVNHPATRGAVPVLAALSASATCTAIGTEMRLDALNAALLNGLSAGANAFDDAHVQTIVHAAAPTVAALLAHCEEHPVSGRDFLLAIVISHEIQSRLSCALAVAPAHCHVGHYMTGLVGPVGVAAGLGKVMGLCEQQLVWAIGLGAMQAGGYRSSHATMASPFIPGNAGRSGLLAARLAASDFTCQDEPLTSANGMLSVVAQPANPDALTAGLGEHWECLNVILKPFPNGYIAHAATDACLQVATLDGFSADDIERIDLDVGPLALQLAGCRHPENEYEAWTSLPHWAAAALLRGRAGLGEARLACINDPQIIALRERVHVSAVSQLKTNDALVTVTLKDGRRLGAEALPHRGAVNRPLSDDEIQQKFLSQVEPQLGESRALELARICWDMETVPDVALAAPGIWGRPVPVEAASAGKSLSYGRG